MKTAHHRRRVIAAATVLATTGWLATLATAAPGASAAGSTTIPNTVPKWLARATRSKTRPAGATKQTVRVYLAPRGGTDALKAEVAALSDPTSPDYRHWLTPAEYAATYGPSDSAVTAVKTYLDQQGLTVGTVEAHNRYVSATGSRSTLEKAFGITLASYRHDGQDVVAPADAVTVPTSLGADVLTVTGLDTTKRSLAPAATPPDAFVPGRPCSLSFGAVKATYQADYKTPLPAFQGKTLSYAPCGYTGPQYRSAYEGNSALDGSGVTVAITDAYAWQFIAKDANKYAVAHGDGSYAAGQLSQVVPAKFTNKKACDPSGWSGEETLDVEAVHAMAPAANIRYYASASCLDDDFQTALANVVDENQAQLVSNSWADVEQVTAAGTVQAYEQIFLQGATQGISFLFSSGDNGDELANTGLKQVDYPASDPYVTGVGGTSTGIDGNGALSFQTGWGTTTNPLSADGTSWTPGDFLYGAGGGYSALFGRPAYQTGVTTGEGRGVPDIAMDGDPNTGMLVGQTQTFPDGVRYGEYRIGGTSLASPLSAGFLALASQKAGNRLGFLNPTLYAQPTLTVDVKHAGPLGVVRADNINGVDASGGIKYSVRTFDQDSSLNTKKGWDQVTGLGVLSTALLK